MNEIMQNEICNDNICTKAYLSLSINRKCWHYTLTKITFFFCLSAFQSVIYDIMSITVEPIPLKHYGSHNYFQIKGLFFFPIYFNLLQFHTLFQTQYP